MNEPQTTLRAACQLIGKMLTNLRYADDTTLLTNVNEAKMKMMLNRVSEESAKLGLKINLSKSKLIVVDRDDILE